MKEQRDEKMIERAYKKLALDALVIQQGRLAEQKTVNKDELLQMVRFGAEMVFSSKDSTITDEDIDRIIAKGEEATVELDAKMKKFAEDAIKFKMDDTVALIVFLSHIGSFVPADVATVGLTDSLVCLADLEFDYIKTYDSASLIYKVVLPDVPYLYYNVRL
ncbi:unnamed protein product [Camellia sinensis]